MGTSATALSTIIEGIMETRRTVLAFVLFRCLVEKVASQQCNVGPLHFTEGETEKIDCDFTAPTGVVYWYKDDNLIINGTQGLYHTEDQLNDDTFRSTLHFSTIRQEHEGFYKSCTGDASAGRLCSKYEIEVLVYCGQRGHITATHRIVSAVQFSSARVQCSALSWAGCLFGPALTWHYRNSTLQNNTKYVINEQPKYECKHRSLQAEFNLEISNVTDEDVGEYYCEMNCAFPRLVANDTIELLVFKPEITGKSSSYTEVTFYRTSPTMLSKDSSTRRLAGKWIVSVVIAIVFVLYSSWRWY